MKIALINRSPKVENSSSEFILTSVKSLLPADSVFKEFKFNRPILNEIELEKIADTDVLIFAFPLYVDGIPSHLLHCLDQIDLVKLRRTSGTLKNDNWLRTDTGADSRVSNEAFGGCRT